MWLKINAIKALSDRNLEMQSKTLIHLFKMWIRPIVLYGAPAYHSAAKTYISRIHVLQNSALRVALRRSRRTHIENLHKEGSLWSSHRFMGRKVDDSLMQRLLTEHKIMLNYDIHVCRKASPSKTPID